jgi:hypothetical protein
VVSLTGDGGRRSGFVIELFDGGSLSGATGGSIVLSTLCIVGVVTGMEFGTWSFAEESRALTGSLDVPDAWAVEPVEVEIRSLGDIVTDGELVTTGAAVNDFDKDAESVEVASEVGLMGVAAAEEDAGGTLATVGGASASRVGREGGTDCRGGSACGVPSRVWRSPCSAVG